MTFDELLIQLGTDDDRARARLERELAQCVLQDLERVETDVRVMSARIRASWARVLGRVHGGRGRASLCALLTDEDTKVRQWAAVSLGKVGTIEDEDVLLDALTRATSDPERRSIVEALGKKGGPSARAVIEQLVSTHQGVSQARTRALLMLERSKPKVSLDASAFSRPPPVALAVLLYTKPGLEEIVCEEIASVGLPRIAASGVTAIEWQHPPVGLFSSRVMDYFAFELTPEVATVPDDVPLAVLRALKSNLAENIFAHYGVAPHRVRIAWADGAHHRSWSWSVAELLAKSELPIQSAPSGADWEARVRIVKEHVFIALSPLFLGDPRFSYRVADVPAASHPTVAAALARWADLRRSDVVWDPFCGSGLELIECAKRVPQVRLFGSDLSQGALDAASKNAKAANVVMDLRRVDALSSAPNNITCIVTNPPFGRRVRESRPAADMLCEFLVRAGEYLPRDGRLVWLTPAPFDTDRAAHDAGFHVEKLAQVDLGGLRAEAQRLFRGR